MGMLTVSLLCPRIKRATFANTGQRFGPFFAPLPLDGRGLQPLFAMARFSTSFAAKQRFCRLFAKPQNCAQMASTCAQMGGEQFRPMEPGRVLDIISLSEHNIKS